MNYKCPKCGAIFNHMLIDSTTCPHCGNVFTYPIDNKDIISKYNTNIPVTMRHKE